MSRIEKNQHVVEEMHQMKEEIKEAARPTRHRSFFRSCALVLGVAVLFLAGWIAWVLAATGIVPVPVLSSFAYAPPVPTRVVEPGVPFETVERQQMPTSSLSIPEPTLTTELRSVLETSGQTILDADAAQVAVLSGSGIELFLPLRDNAQGSAVVLVVSGSVNGEALDISLASARVGSWKIPKFIRDGIIVPILQGAVDGIRDQTDPTIRVTGVTPGDGRLLFTLESQ